MKIAIIGGGVSGLSMAYFLQTKNINFVLFEKEKVLGGNAHTRKVIQNGKEKYVDLAVNDFNPQTYKLLSHLLVKAEAKTGEVKVNTTFHSKNRFVFKESTIDDAEILENLARFKREAMEVLTDQQFAYYSVKEYFETKGYAPKFLSDYLYPRIQGLFFYPKEGMNHLPVSFVMHFYATQCGFQVGKTPASTRYNFKNGAGSWIENFTKLLPADKIKQGETPSIERVGDRYKVHYSDGAVWVDRIVFACHADDLFQGYAAVLTEAQKNILSKVKYSKMVSVAHCDTSYLPVGKGDFSAYNCLVKKEQSGVNHDYTITYNCNAHQNLPGAAPNTGDDYFFVTVNPIRKIKDKYILKDPNGKPVIKAFRRNICDFNLLYVQKAIKNQQGSNSLYFVGGYTNGIGLHEHCLNQSAAVAELIFQYQSIYSRMQQKQVPITPNAIQNENNKKAQPIPT